MVDGIICCCCCCCCYLRLNRNESPLALVWTPSGFVHFSYGYVYYDRAATANTALAVSLSHYLFIYLSLSLRLVLYLSLFAVPTRRREESLPAHIRPFYDLSFSISISVLARGYWTAKGNGRSPSRQLVDNMRGTNS